MNPVINSRIKLGRHKKIIINENKMLILEEENTQEKLKIDYFKSIIRDKTI